MKNRISSFCRIKNRQINLNGELVFSALNSNFTAFSKEAYQLLSLNYLKFFKMDNLSKVAFLCADLLLRTKNIAEKFKPEEIAVCICNSSSSIDTDQKHNESIKDRNNYFPSPSIFVYTLPNIMLGEICIRNNFKGENACFIQEAFDPHLGPDWVNAWMDEAKCGACIMGWVDFENEKEDALLCLIEKSTNTNLLELNSHNYKNIYLTNL